MMIGMVELETLLCIAGDVNAHIGETESGEEENVGKCGWGTRNQEGQAMVEFMARNGLAFVGSFFQKRESHKITYRSGHHKTELDLVLIRKQQLWRMKDCKVIAGEHITTQHKPVVLVVRMNRAKPNIKVNGNQPDGGMLHLYGQKKKAAKKAVDKARNDMEADLYTKLDEDAGKKMIYKMARYRNE